MLHAGSEVSKHCTAHYIYSAWVCSGPATYQTLHLYAIFQKSSLTRERESNRLNLTFIIASVTTNISALLVGGILDRHGPRVCGITSSLLLALGALIMAFSSSLSPIVDGYIIASFLLALGGTFTFVPTFHLANAFPRQQGLILALVTGAFDASASIFLLFRVLYQQSPSLFSTRNIFLGYALTIPPFILLTQLFIMPASSYQTRGSLTEQMSQALDSSNDIHDSDDELPLTATQMMRLRSDRASQRRMSIASLSSVLGTPAQQTQQVQKEHAIRDSSGVWGVLHGMPASQQLRSPWFVLITLFTILQMARFNFFIATIWSQYVYLLNSTHLADGVIEFFDLALPLGGVVTVPFIGALLDHTSTVSVLNLLVLVSTIIGVLGAVPTLWAAYANVTLFVLFRPLYYSAISDYAAKVFGYATFGTVYGAIICLSGVFTFSQSLLQAMLHDVCDDDPEPINLGLAAAGLILGVALVMYVDVKGGEMKRAKAGGNGQPAAASASAGGWDETSRLLNTPSQRGGGGATYGSVRSVMSAGDLFTTTGVNTNGNMAGTLPALGTSPRPSPSPNLLATRFDDDNTNANTTALTAASGALGAGTVPSQAALDRMRHTPSRSQLQAYNALNQLSTVRESASEADDDDEEVLHGDDAEGE